MLTAHRHRHLGTAVDCSRFCGHDRNFRRAEELKTCFLGYRRQKLEQWHDKMRVQHQLRKAVTVPAGHARTHDVEMDVTEDVVCFV